MCIILPPSSCARKGSAQPEEKPRELRKKCHQRHKFGEVSTVHNPRGMHARRSSRCFFGMFEQRSASVSPGRASVVTPGEHGSVGVSCRSMLSSRSLCRWSFTCCCAALVLLCLSLPSTTTCGRQIRAPQQRERSTTVCRHVHVQVFRKARLLSNVGVHEPTRSLSTCGVLGFHCCAAVH